MIGAPGRGEMSEEAFRAVRDAIHDYAGLRFDDDRKFLLERRLAPRLEATGARDFTEYAWLLCRGGGNGAELQQAVERVVTHETYFFREGYQLRAFSDEILADIEERRPRGRQLRIWSAGCSTGEEVYTASMLLLETGRCRDWDVSILGTDISGRAVRAARAGRYRRSSLRETDATRERRFFTPRDGLHAVREEVVRPTSFAQQNLLDPDADAPGDIDVLFCRNVLIYFDRTARERVIRSFYRQLAPGGYLLLGHAETLLHLSTEFELVQLRDDTVYRKPGTAR